MFLAVAPDVMFAPSTRLNVKPASMVHIGTVEDTVQLSQKSQASHSLRSASEELRSLLIYLLT